MIKGNIDFGRYIGYNLEKTPRRLVHFMAYYNFASKVIGKNKRILDVGCNEGLGTALLAQECGEVLGVDFDEDAIEAAKRNFSNIKGLTFLCEDFQKFDEVEKFDAIVNFDVIEHIEPQNAARFISKSAALLKNDGVMIIGTPNVYGQVYASEVSKQGHINCYDMPRLEEEVSVDFNNVFMFGANDEIVHTGYFKMCHYIMAVAFNKKNR